MGTSDLEPLHQASLEQAVAFFRKETDDFANGAAFGNPQCPQQRTKLCDCPKTKAYLGQVDECAEISPCVVRVILFPNGTYQ